MIEKGMQEMVCGGQWETKEAKPNMILAATKKTQCFLLCGACLLAACSRGWVQHCGMMTFVPECLLLVFSERSRENEMDCMEQQVPADTVLSFTHVLASCRWISCKDWECNECGVAVWCIWSILPPCRIQERWTLCWIWGSVMNMEHTTTIQNSGEMNILQGQGVCWTQSILPPYRIQERWTLCWIWGSVMNMEHTTTIQNSGGYCRAKHRGYYHHTGFRRDEHYAGSGRVMNTEDITTIQDSGEMNILQD